MRNTISSSVMQRLHLCLGSVSRLGFSSNLYLYLGRAGQVGFSSNLSQFCQFLALELCQCLPQFLMLAGEDIDHTV